MDPAPPGRFDFVLDTGPAFFNYQYILRHGFQTDLSAGPRRLRQRRSRPRSSSPRSAALPTALTDLPSHRSLIQQIHALSSQSRVRPAVNALSA